MKDITRRVFLYSAGVAGAVTCSPGMLALSEVRKEFAASHADAKVAVLDDFETPASLKGWVGKVSLSTEHPSHGKQSLKVNLSPDGLSTDKLPKDWRGYDRFLMDIYNPGSTDLMLNMGIYDGLADDATANYLKEAFLVNHDLFLIPGMNHIEIKLTGLQVSARDRKLDLGKIRRFTITGGGAKRPVEIYLDNLRLVRGVEGAETASVRRPEDGTLVMGNGFCTLSQVGPRDAIPESAEVKRKREEARQESRRLRDTIRAAQMMGASTIYQEIALVTAKLGLEIRPQVSWFNNDRAKSEMFDYVAATCRASRMELDDRISGVQQVPSADDTEVGKPLVPAYPPLRGLKMKDGFFVNEAGDPLLILSLHSPSMDLTRFFATPRQHIESYTAGGGSRWTIDQSPVYKAYEKYPDTHRVGWDGWCGHLIRDRWSMGGGIGTVVICLESPHIKRAIAEYIQREAPKWKQNPQLLYNIMGYELQYICYCQRSQQMFREWLRQKHQNSIEQVNTVWKTKFKTFDEITAPPVHESIPLPGTNRAEWYDWACFNQERFTNHLAWVKGEMLKCGAETPITSGGSYSMLVGSNGTSGIDDEMLMDRVNDLALHEGGHSTLGVDMEWAFAERKRPLADPEHNGSVWGVLPHFLHGKSVMQMYHWPSYPDAAMPHENVFNIPYSWGWPLDNVGELLRVALDVRRLNKEIAALASARPEVATLYSKTSIIQIAPELMRATSTPYLDELDRVYDGSLYLDANTTLISESQILKGRASEYKVILVPAVKHTTPEVTEALLQYVSGGGHLVIAPESFMTDQYLRPLDFFEKVGIRILKSSATTGYKMGAAQQQYDQTWRQSATLSGTVDREIVTLPCDEFGTAPLKLHARGVVQAIEVGKGSTEVARFTGGGPAIVRHILGKGRVYVLAMPLDPQSYAQVFDRLFEHANVSRPVRFTDPSGERIWQLEARSSREGGDWLMSIINQGKTKVTVKVDWPAEPKSLKDLRSGESIAPDGVITLAPRETRLMRVD